ncbi:MAG TPA: hypothetical protein VGV90_10540 [Solirubrobacteraceae bacterium]|nr:hypothetical protein [Solirubrobacteraceae bacterium]
MRRFLACAAWAVVLATGLSAPAQAQRDGIFIDPDGPTAREYEIPLEAERRRIDGLAGRGAGVRRADPVAGDADAGPAAELFGRGVTPRGARSQRARVPERSSNRPKAADEPASAAGLPSVARLERQQSSPDTSMLIAGGAILGLGLIGGLLRRRLSPH